MYISSYWWRFNGAPLNIRSTGFLKEEYLNDAREHQQIALTRLRRSHQLRTLSTFLLRYLKLVDSDYFNSGILLLLVQAKSLRVVLELPYF